MTLQASPESKPDTVTVPEDQASAPADGQFAPELPDDAPKAYRVKSRRREAAETILPPLVLGMGVIGLWYYITFVVIDESRRFLMRPVHDVVNVFMCTGYTRDSSQYFMKASPARAGDFIELFAEIDLLAGESACPGGNCGASHSSDAATCHRVRIDIFRPREEDLAGWRPAEASGYGGGHGAG